MSDFEEGRITETEARYDKLLHSHPPLTPRQELDCRRERSTVLACANRWQEAMAELVTCDDLVHRLVPFERKPTLSVILHAKVKLLADPDADTYDLAAALRLVDTLRGQSSFPWLADELESDLALKGEDWERCVQCSSFALHRFEAEGWRKPVAVLRRRMGEARMHLNQFELAQKDLQTAYDFFKDFGTPDDLARTQLSIARLKSQRGEHDDAWGLALGSLANIELLIRNFRVVAEQQQFLRDKLRFYDDCFDIGLARGNSKGLRRAWTIAERAKSFHLCQLLANASVPLFEGIDPKVIERLRKLEMRLDACTRAILLCEPAGRDNKEREQQTISAERQKLLFQIMKDNPRWAAVKAPVRADIDEVLRALPAPWVPISYFWRDHRDGGADLFIFFAGLDRELQLATVLWSKEEVATLAECRRLLSDAFGPQSRTEPLQQSLAKVFPDDLIRELEACQHLRLLISPHAHLRGLPVHAFDLGGEDYVIKHWPVQYVPTLAMALFARPKPVADKVLLMGCPITPRNPVELKGVPQEIGRLHSIWQAKRPGRVDSCIIAPAGSPDQAGFPLSKWHEYQLLHFSCHGNFPASAPLDAALLLGSDDVHPTELFCIQLQASLIVLSACHLGKQGSVVTGSSGDEWLGFYLPMFYAGAGQLLVSLWEADDATAENIMDRLYSATADGVPASEGLQQALCAQIESSPEQLWANWFLVGVPEHIS